MTNTLKSIAVPIVLGVVAIGLVVGVPIWALRHEQQARIAVERSHAQLQAEFEDFQGQVKQNSDQAKKLASEAQKQLKDEHQAIEENKNAQISDLERRVVLLVGELRKRPSRQDAATATGAGDGAGGPGQAQLHCTGAQLFGEDAEFLAGEAAAAETLRQELMACEGKLNTTSQATKSLSNRGIFFAH